ncbi:carboxypeptidase regulatory-like domain-containing protein [Hyalangium versicolor]|uniref:carboxypeptidase regulatory-like domain-containing protein n=1 Tax=Hyalangium versicolor TaxID=2861190 RepID=UPI001CCA1E89|nr:carboxypeptidase regulatory-like domain-containing protein [Hyalangium versicolor]
MPLRVFIYRATLLLVSLVFLPGAISVYVDVSGRVRFSDGTSAAGVTVFLQDSSSGTSYTTTTDGSGLYALEVPRGTYHVGVQLLTPSFSGSQILITSGNFGVDSLLNLTTQDVMLEGHLLENNKRPCSAAQLVGVNATGEFHVTANSAGEYSVRIFAGPYIHMRMVGNTQSPCLMENLPNRTFSSNVFIDYRFPDISQCDAPREGGGTGGGNDQDPEESQPIDPPPNPPGDPGTDGPL